MRLVIVPVVTLFTILPFNVQAAGVSGLTFSHGDWELVCDNTRTCRAAGYQRDEDKRAVSVLLTRKAGPHEPLTGHLMLGQLDEDEIAEAQRLVGRLSLYINGEIAGSVETRPYMADLSESVIAALLPALLRDSEIEWVASDHRWRLSDTGAAAVLLKMDDFQGRVDTPGALVRKGSRSEDQVLPPLPEPVVIAAPVPDVPSSDRLLTATEAKHVREALHATISDDEYCPYMTEAEGGEAELTAYRLSETRLLISTQCWIAAYNAGLGYWVVEEAPPYRPVLVTTDGTDYSKGTIWAGHKGRGIGDCWSLNEWTWDGEQFIHTASSTTGLCKWVAAGGAWSLPTIITEVRRATAESATKHHTPLTTDHEQRVLECESAFPPTMTAASLVERFGAENILNTDIPIGEGFYEPGTVVFPESDALKVEILWQDTESLAVPGLVRVRGEQSAWRTKQGLSLGDDLLIVEQLNGEPFQLTGFEWDYAGTQLSWSGGVLKRKETAGCGVRVRFQPDDPSDQMEWYLQVLGDGEYSSGHPAMQALNPGVYELWLEY